MALVLKADPRVLQLKGIKQSEPIEAYNEVNPYERF